MVGAILLIGLLYLINLPLLNIVKSRVPYIRLSLLKNLYWYHILFAGIYYVFALYSPSDSVAYFNRPQNEYDGWLEIYQTGTRFIDFISYPFIMYLRFSYEMMMVLFAWTGYWGFVYFYSAFKENIRYRHSFFGQDLITLIIFLPNMHYWTASLGKGSLIFLALGMTFYGLSRLKTRQISLLMGLLIIYHIRPHIFFIMAIGIVIGLVTGGRKVPAYQKFIVVGGSLLAVIFLYNQILAFAGLDGDNLVGSLDELSGHRAEELAKSGSGIDISNYSVPLKLFTFWFRPLFIDAPGIMGLVISFENLFYIFLTAKLFSKGIIRFIRLSPALVKTGLVVFLATSFALSGTLSNMGIIMRQKSMVMFFLLFAIVAFMDYKKSIQVHRRTKSFEHSKLKRLTLT